MITNFKIFESKDDYNVGDYVLLDLDQIEKNNKYQNWIDAIDIPDDNLAKIDIIKINNKLPYIVKFYNGKIFLTNDNEILRKLTPKEIEEYEMKKDTKNFNL